MYTPEQQAEHTELIRNFAYAVRNINTTELIRLDVMTESAQADATSEEDRKKPWELPAYTVLHKKDLVLDLGAVEWLEQKLGGTFFHDGNANGPVFNRENFLAEMAEEESLIREQGQQLLRKIEELGIDRAIAEEFAEDQAEVEDETPTDSTAKQPSA